MATTTPRRVTRGAVIAGRVPALPSIRDLTNPKIAESNALPNLNPVDLPPEVLSLICDELVAYRKTLACLCRTSRTFHRIAQHVLYHIVDLEDLPESLVISFFQAVARRPHLGARVHSLTIPIRAKVVRQDSDFAETFAAALRACVNLEDLSILADRDALRNRVPKPPWIFHECPPFRLTTFVNSYFDFGPELVKFLESQPTLRVLAAPGASSSHAIIKPVPKLPNVVALCMHINFLSQSVVEQWPLERIETSLPMRHDFRLLHTLGRYSTTLITLNLAVALWFPPAEIIRQVSGLCPALRHFAITELHGFGT
ncbi:hypothetical protein HMN09_00731600 [Mycena chlorophos]|uniref:F-box domain-containing protein n=1 Tax=Mycena chlorophos TaxID=658473 RepID=A0A8H6SUT1_MYCCL|nr:hypothetical protein HMN09_00731600 [Mycena chlorophos]